MQITDNFVLQKLVIMKAKIILLLPFLALYAIQPVSGQSNCKVLKPEISLNYKGDCKNGLAHGKGEAFGTDQYTGQFKKGYPDGEGTYKWAAGEIYTGHWKRGMRHGAGELSLVENNKDTTIVGKWVKDKYVGLGTSSSQYKITYKNNIGRITVNRMGPGNQIRFKFMRNGGEIAPGNFLLYGDSGTTSAFRQFLGYEHIEFPLKGRITFSVPNNFNTATLNCELSFIMIEPGSYEIYIYP